MTQYSPIKLEEARKREERRLQKEKEFQESCDRWNAAMDWAREHGADLRKGKVSKDLAKFRIYKAGLMEEFNEAWPMYSFNYEQVELAAKRLIERDKEFAKKKKKPYVPKKDPFQKINDKYSL